MPRIESWAALTATCLALGGCSDSSSSSSPHGSRPNLDTRASAVVTPLPLPTYDASKVANPTATVSAGTGAISAIPASFSVSEGGSASYSIPLRVVPGFGNFQPRLSLTYNSNAGNGPVGVGFAIGGLSQISRCARTVADDGIAEGVRLADSDRFCLNGLKLALVSGTYGGDNAEYRTIPDTHVRVRSFRIAGATAGPYGFEVRTPNGEQQLYGDSQFVAIKANGATVNVSWPITSASDTSLDSIHYTYEKRLGADGGEVERWIKSIEYGTTQTRDRKIDFEYESRLDRRFGYLYGSKRENLRRLKSVTMSKLQGSTPVRARSYHLSYLNSGPTELSKLSSLLECGTQLTECKMPTTFQWQLGEASFASGQAQTAPAPSSATSMMVTADLNGDGRTDLAYPEVGTWKYVLGQAGGMPYPLVQNGPPNPVGTSATALPFDYDLDGRSDLLPRFVQVLPWRPFLSRGDSGGWVQAFTEFSGPLNWDSSEPKPVALFGDFDGDGYQDVLEHRAVNGGTSAWTWRRRTGTVSSHIDDPSPSDGEAFGPQLDLPALDFKDPDQVMVLDLDDDGRDEVLINKGLSELQAYDPTGSRPLRGTGLANAVLGLDVITLDLNGDGLTDMVTNGDDSGSGKQAQLFYRLNLGGRFAPPVVMFISESVAAFPHSEVMDLDGDGRDELLLARAALVPGGGETVFGGLDLVRSSFGVDGTLLFTRSLTSITFGGRTAAQLGQQGTRVVDANGDGLRDVLVIDRLGGPGTIMLFRHLGSKPDLLVSLRDGRNFPSGDGVLPPPTVELSYAPLTDGSVYQRGECPRSSHVMCLSGSMHVVKEAREDAGLGTDQPTPAAMISTYSYKNGRLDKKSRSFLGFAEQMVRTAPGLGGTVGAVVTRSFFTNSDRDLDPRLKERWTYSGLPGNRQFLERTTQAWVKKITPSSYFNYVSRAERKRYEFPAMSLDTLSISDFNATSKVPYRESAVQSSNIDIYGNVGQKETTYGQNVTVDFTRVITTYDLDVASWLLRRPKTIETTDAVWDAEQAAQVKKTRTSSFTYRTTNGIDKEKPLNEQRFASAASPGKVLSIDYEYGASGNTVRTTTKDLSTGEVRESTAAYDPDGYPHAVRNGLGHTSYTGYDPVLGALKVIVDAGGLRTDVTFDTLGRQRKTRLPGGAEQTVSYELEVVGNEYLLRTESADGTGARSQVVVDRLGRVVRTRFNALDGGLRERTRRYNTEGMLAEETTAHPVGSTASLEKTVYQYDSLGRMIRSQDPDGAVHTWAFSGLTATATDSNHVASSTTASYRGEKALSIDAEGTDDEARRSYAYGPFETLLRTQVVGIGASLSTYEYDERNRLLSQSDAERGATTYGYDAFGALTFSRDANGRETTLVYDALGRVDTRTVRQNGDLRSVVDYTYDALGGQQKPGLLLQEQLIDYAGGERQSTTGYAFDALNRLQGTAQTLPSESNPAVAETLQVGYDHDAFGRMRAVRYPLLTGQTAATEVRYEYGPAATSNGQLQRVKVADAGAVEVLLWEAVASDSQGRLVEEHTGDGVRTQREYDWRSGVSELYVTTSMADVDPGKLLISEIYGYDGEGNLSSRRRYHAGIDATEQFRYDSMNRLTAASMGSLAAPDDTWTYDQLSNITSSARRGTYSYDAQRPTQVTAVSGGLFGARSYGYDAIGNQITRPDGTVTYNDFNLPVRIESAGGVTLASFLYTAGGQRARKVSTAGSITYLPGLYERHRTLAGTEHRLLVAAGSRNVATLSYKPAGPVLARQILYPHGERLGSTSLVTTNQASSGLQAVVKESRSYDAFGLLRNPNWSSSDFLGGLQAAVIAQGYTGHDDDRELGLINMKGRIYDPKLGRFLTADPNVDGASPSQAWNRYKYVSNNPLRATDPSGFEECMDFFCEGQNADEGGAGGWFSETVAEWWAEDDDFFEEGPHGIDPLNTGSQANTHIDRQAEKHDRYVAKEMERVDRKEERERMKALILKLKAAMEEKAKVGRQSGFPSPGPRLAQQDVCPDNTSCTTNISGCSGEGQNQTCSDVGPQYSDSSDGTGGAGGGPSETGTDGKGGAPGYGAGSSGGADAGLPQLPPGTFVYGGLVTHAEVPMLVGVEAELIGYVGTGRDGVGYGGAMLTGGMTSSFHSILVGGEVQVNRNLNVGAALIGVREWSVGPFNMGRIDNLTSSSPGATYFGVTLGEHVALGFGREDP